MQGQPGPPEEFIEDVIGLTMTIGETAAHDVNTEVVVEF